LEGSGPEFRNVMDRLVRAGLLRARGRRLFLDQGAEEAVRSLASRATTQLQAQGLIDDEHAIARAEESIVRVIDSLPAPEFERREGGLPPPTVDELVVMRAFAGLCPGLWPLC
jgi:hypothetical protein